MTNAFPEAHEGDWESLPVGGLLGVVLPHILPASWTDVTPASFEPYAKAFASNLGIRVLVSVEKKQKEDVWVHVSLSRQERLPSWEDVKEVKDLFVGRDRVAIQVLPRSSEYINHHPYVLHLWSNISNPQFIPDFRRNGTL